MHPRDILLSSAVLPILRCGLRSDCGPEVSALGGISAGVYFRYTSHGPLRDIASGGAQA